MTNLPRRERQNLAYRNEILVAAERVFSQKGFHAASMAEIAREAEFSMGTLYKFFPSKEALYVALIEEHFHRFLDGLEGKVKEWRDPRRALESVVKTHLDYFDKHKAFFLIYLQDRLALEWRIKERLGEGVYRLHLAYLAIVTGIMTEAIRSGLLKPFPPEDLAHLLISMVNSSIFQWIHAGNDHPLAGKLPVIMELFMEGAGERANSGVEVPKGGEVS